MSLDVIKSGKKSQFEWKIRNFSLKKDSYESPKFQFEDVFWCLQVFPNCSNGYMYLQLMRTSSGSPITVEFSIALKSVDGWKVIKNHKRSCFKKWETYWKIWNHRSEFVRRQREFLLHGCLTIIIIMKRVDSIVNKVASFIPGYSWWKRIRGVRISLHKDCFDKAAKCPRCEEIVSSQNWFDHLCQKAIVKGETGTSQPSAFSPKSKIFKDFKQMFLNQENCDVVLRVQGKEFTAHKHILMARSLVFASTFRCNMKETVTDTVDIEDVDSSCFSEFLCFLYCGEIDKLSAENVCSLFTAADKYFILDLRTMCVEFMIDNLSVDVFCEVLALSLLHSESDLTNACEDFFLKNAREITKTDKWESFAAENPEQSTKLLMKHVKSTAHSNKKVSIIAKVKKKINTIFYI